MIISKNSITGLRSIEKEDLRLIQSWRNSSYMRQFFREYRELSMTHIEDWYAKMIADRCFEMFCIVDMQGGQAIGVAGLTYIDYVNRHADVHFYIGEEEAWIDSRFSSEAFMSLRDYGFNILNLNKLWAEVYSNDKKKLRFLRSHGFKVDATLRQHYYFNGEYLDSHILSVLKEENGL